MNLETLCKLVNEAGQSRAIITIDTNGEDAVVIVTVPTAGTCLPNLDNQKEMALRQALSIPMRVMGKVTDLDLEIDNHLSEFAEGFSPAAQALPLVVKTNATAAKEKQVKAAETASKGASKKEMDNAKKVVEAPKESPVEKAKITTPVSDNFDIFADSSL